MVDTRLYGYVGPEEIRLRVLHQPPGRVITSSHDVRTWIRETGQEPNGGLYRSTFVVDAERALRVED